MAQEAEDPARRLELLIAGASALIARRFLKAIKEIRSSVVLSELEELLRRRQFEQALAAATLAASGVAAEVTQAYIRSAQGTARFIERQLGVTVTFDQTNTRAVEAMRRSQLRLVREFLNDQRTVVRLAMVDGISRGLNPREQARLFRSVIGLTAKQYETVMRYRAVLESGSVRAVTQFALRDKSLDARIRSGRPLTQTQIDRLVRQYQANFIAFRATTIARTEALRATHEGANEAYEQAIRAGLLNRTELVREWVTASDERVRGTHASMSGQQRAIGESFISGAGFELQHPGDANAPASETINCRCVLTTTFAIDATPPADAAAPTFSFPQA